MEQNYFSCFLTIKGTMKIVLELPQLTVLHTYKDICSSFCMRVYCFSFICKEMLNWNSRLICICKNISFHPISLCWSNIWRQHPASVNCSCLVLCPLCVNFLYGGPLIFGVDQNEIFITPWWWGPADFGDPLTVGFIELHQWKVVRITCNNVEADCINTLTLLDTINSITEHICGKKNKSTIVSEKFENDTFHICFQHQVETSHSCAGTLTLTPRSVT